eukprot:scaffold41091_cov48-Phaeocystis_antarctica.AAC.3
MDESRRCASLSRAEPPVMYRVASAMCTHSRCLPPSSISMLTASSTSCVLGSSMAKLSIPVRSRLEASSSSAGGESFSCLAASTSSSLKAFGTRCRSMGNMASSDSSHSPSCSSSCRAAAGVPG